MNSNGFRKELIRIMPGYKWTIHRPFNPNGYLSATGIQTSGLNRLSTLAVIRSERDGKVQYEAKTSGFGKRAPWLSIYKDGTLARALRGLQDYYEIMAIEYGRHANDLKYAREK